MPCARAETTFLPSRRGWLILAAASLILCGCWDRAGNGVSEKPTSETGQAVVSSSAGGVDAERTLAGEPPEDAAPADDVQGGQASGSLSEADPQPVPGFAPTGTWTTQRMVVLAPTGALTVELLVSVSGKSLEESSAEAAEGVIDELLEQLETPSWEALLELPLVRSGWLGNLTADEEQTSQLIDMYDANRDDLVDRVELLPFLTRGLSRLSPLRISQGRPEGSTQGESPWGVADLNRDYALELTEELGQFESSVSQLDVDEDGTITRQEATATADVGAATSMSRSLLDSNTMLEIDLPATGTDVLQGEEAVEAGRKQLRKTVTELLEHYNPSGTTVAREQFVAWPDDWWSQWDTDDDQFLDRDELAAMLAGEPAVSLYVRLPGLVEAASGRTIEMTGAERQMAEPPRPELESRQLHCLTAGTAEMVWTPNGQSGGRLAAAAAAIRVSLADEFSGVAFDRLQMVLEQSLGNSQLKDFLRNQLEVTEKAFDLIDTDGDQQLSDAEFDRVLSWLAVRGGARVVATWRMVGPAWFELLDTDGDGRLTIVERQAASTILSALDQDGDGTLTPYELPLLAGIEVRRSDSRLAGLASPPQGDPSIGQAMDWFSAMDTNGDEVLSFDEFLGNREVFDEMDRDKDGFVSRREVYAAP